MTETIIRQRVREAARVEVEHRSSGVTTAAKVKPESTAPVQPVSPGQPRTHGVLGVEGSVTRNMGDFNSIRVGVYCELPFADGTLQGARDFYPLLSREVDHLLATELALAQGQEPPAHPDDIKE